MYRLRDSDVLLFPSLRDGGGAVVVEAMAAGLPVVCLDVGGPGFHVHDEWGIKIKQGCPEDVIREIAKGLGRLCSDRDLCSKMGEAARQRAIIYYRWDKLGDRLHDIYMDALSDGP